MHICIHTHTLCAVCFLTGPQGRVRGLLYHRNSPDVMLSRWHKPNAKRVLVFSSLQLLLHELRNAYRPLRHIRATALSWNVSNKLAALADEVIREELPIKPLLPPVEYVFHLLCFVCWLLCAYGGLVSFVRYSNIFVLFFLLHRAPTTGVLNTLLNTLSPKDTAATGGKLPAPVSAAPVPKGIARIYVIKRANSELDEGAAFQYLAENYIFRGKPFADICAHNATAAQRVERFQIAQAWHVLRLLFHATGADTGARAGGGGAGGSANASGNSTKAGTPSLTPSNSQRRLTMTAAAAASGSMSPLLPHASSSEPVRVLGVSHRHARARAHKDKRHSRARVHKDSRAHIRTLDTLCRYLFGVPSHTILKTPASICQWFSHTSVYILYSSRTAHTRTPTLDTLCRCNLDKPFSHIFENIQS